MIDYSRDELLTDFGKTTLKDRYLLPTEDSPQDGFLRAAKGGGWYYDKGAER